MRKVVVLFVVLLSVQLASAQTPYKQVSASAEERDGRFYLVLTGDQAEITRICSRGDCSQGFGSRLDAINYFQGLLGASPVPPPPATLSSAVQTVANESADVMPCHPRLHCGEHLPPYPCGDRPCIYVRPPR